MMLLQRPSGPSCCRARIANLDPTGAEGQEGNYLSTPKVKLKKEAAGTLRTTLSCLGADLPSPVFIKN
jgi:hypothetical protein